MVEFAGRIRGRSAPGVGGRAALRSAGGGIRQVSARKPYVVIILILFHFAG
jgi:hypothetical protein